MVRKPLLSNLLQLDSSCSYSILFGAYNFWTNATTGFEGTLLRNLQDKKHIFAYFVPETFRIFFFSCSSLPKLPIERWTSRRQECVPSRGNTTPAFSTRWHQLHTLFSLARLPRISFDSSCWTIFEILQDNINTCVSLNITCPLLLASYTFFNQYVKPKLIYHRSSVMEAAWPSGLGAGFEIWSSRSDN